MLILWIGGVMFAMRSCSEIAFLRGDEAIRQNLESQLAAVDDPMLHAELVRQRAWLEASGEHHRRAFPVAVGRLLLQMFLVLAAGAVVAGRRGARGLVMQALLANAAFVLVAYAALEPVRTDAVEAVAHDVLNPGSPANPLRDQLAAGETDDRAGELVRAEYGRIEVARSGFEVSLYLLGLLALTRRRARAYFAAVDAPLPDPESP